MTPSKNRCIFFKFILFRNKGMTPGRRLSSMFSKVRSRRESRADHQLGQVIFTGRVLTFSKTLRPMLRSFLFRISYHHHFFKFVISRTCARTHFLSYGHIRTFECIRMLFNFFIYDLVAAKRTLWVWASDSGGGKEIARIEFPCMKFS